MCLLNKNINKKSQFTYFLSVCVENQNVPVKNLERMEKYNGCIKYLYLKEKNNFKRNFYFRNEVKAK